MKTLAFLITLVVTSSCANAQQWVQQCTGIGNNKVCRQVLVGTPTYTNYNYSTPTYSYPTYTYQSYDSHVEPYVVVKSTPVVSKKVDAKKVEAKKVEVKATEAKPMFIVAPVVEVELASMSTRLILK